MINLYLMLGIGAGVIFLIAWAKFESWRVNRANAVAKAAQESAKQSNTIIDLNRRDSDKQNALVSKQVDAAKKWAEAHRLDDEL